MIGCFDKIGKSKNRTKKSNTSEGRQEQRGFRAMKMENPYGGNEKWTLGLHSQLPSPTADNIRDTENNLWSNRNNHHPFWTMCSLLSVCLVSVLLLHQAGCLRGTINILLLYLYDFETCCPELQQISWGSRCHCTHRLFPDKHCFCDLADLPLLKRADSFFKDHFNLHRRCQLKPKVQLYWILHVQI